MTRQPKFFEISALQRQRAKRGEHYLEFLRVPAMSTGVYVLSAGGIDSQTPHLEDEMYYVVSGRARMRLGSEERLVSAGSVIFVPAHLDHRFFDIVEELVVLVFFAPPES